jgi:peptide/nickel transport system substrate-binding protein
MLPPRSLIARASMLAFLVAVVAAGCAPSASSPLTESSTAAASADRPSGALDVAFNVGPATIDPANACNQGDYRYVRALYDTLVVESVKGDRVDASEIAPSVAERWEVSEDGRTYTFHLRDGITFSSGNPLTAEDVVYSLQRTVDKQGCAWYFWTGGLLENIESITAVDDRTVEVKLKEADPLFLLDTTFNIGIVDKKVLEANGGLTEAGDQWLAANSAGSGPFTLGEYDPTRRIVLEARPDYWGGPPKPSQVDVQVVPDASTMELLVESGELDLAYGIPFQSLDRLATNPKVAILSQPATVYVNLGLNTKVAPLDDPQVRQALKLATPINQIIESFGYGHVQPWVGPILPAQLFYNEIVDPYPYDPERAKALLAEAGKGPIDLTLDLKSGDATQLEIATVIQAAWKDIGVNLTVNPISAAEFAEKVGGFKHDIYMIEDQATIKDPGFFFGYYLRCGDPFNWSQYCNPTVDEHLAEARHSSDQARRQQLYDDVVATVAEEVPYIQLFQKDEVWAASSSLDGWIFSDDGAPNFEDLSS